FVGIMFAAVTAVILLTDIHPADSYYGESAVPKENISGHVTMSIRCDILDGIAESDFIPENGYILEETEFAISEGDTVYDILIEAAKQYGISVEHKGTSDMAYISGINYLYELDYGDLSGWVYMVNNELPSVGCAGYRPCDGDRIEWCYTLDLGNDCKKTE
ncbi:MAG: DUF4430 domain-containing protein, partial [Lachnospiraceae bacterium]|nr:DUF4430 domain-containing protein [Lachnospiraceae bacterium]